MQKERSEDLPLTGNIGGSEGQRKALGHRPDDFMRIAGTTGTRSDGKIANIKRCIRSEVVENCDRPLPDTEHRKIKATIALRILRGRHFKIHTVIMQQILIPTKEIFFLKKLNRN